MIRLARSCAHVVMCLTLWWVAGLSVPLLSALLQACGLYYMAELAEEYSRLTKKILTYCIQGVIGIHVLLLIFDRFPFFTTVYGIGLHVVYYQVPFRRTILPHSSADALITTAHTLSMSSRHVRRLVWRAQLSKSVKSKLEC